MTSHRPFRKTDTQKARSNFEHRTIRSQTQDLIRIADIAPNIEAYLKAPNRFDWSNVDGPDPKLIFSHKSKREQSADLAKLATKAPIEVWIKDTSQHDIQGVDTPLKAKNKETLKGKIIKKFKVVKKDQVEQDAKEAKKEAEKKAAEKPKEAEKAELKTKEEANSPLIEGQNMPTHDEIIAKAKELYMHDNARFPELGTNLPEESELREEGYIKRAQTELLTKEDTKATRVVMDYIGNLKNELEQIGFTIVPIEGFSL